MKIFYQFFFVGFLLFNGWTSSAQNIIHCMDYDKIVEHTLEAELLDGYFDDLDRALQRAFRNYIVELKDQYNKYHRLIDGSCASLAQIKKFEEELTHNLDKFNAFATFVSDSVSIMRSEGMNDIKTIVKEELKLFLDSRDEMGSIVLDTKDLIYTDSTLDITSYFSKYLYKKRAPIKISYEVSIIFKKIKEKYKVKEHADAKSFFSKPMK